MTTIAFSLERLYTRLCTALSAGAEVVRSAHDPRPVSIDLKLRAQFALLLAAALQLLAARASAHAPGLERELPALSEYFRLGIEHILTGFDHLAFLLGLLLVANRTRSIVLAISAFTLAHSLSLALAVFDLARPPSAWIEPLIALSIVYVAIENFAERDARARWRITLLFGFVHGFGFAGALEEIGVPQDRAPAALALFNLGVELGQLSVLGLLLPGLNWLRRSPAGWRSVTRVANAALLLAGLGWTVERVLDAQHVVAGEVPAQASAQTTIPEAESGPDDKRVTASVLSSVYPRNPPASNDADRLCEVFARLPRERRAACEQSKPGVTLERECSRVLRGALASGALRFERAAADSCEAAQRAHYADCSFSARPAKAIAACEALFEGTLGDGAQCRSSLECARGAFCHGVGPFDLGECGAPKSAGASCGRGADPLAAYLPNREADHPECQGRCVQGRCRPKP